MDNFKDAYFCIKFLNIQRNNEDSHIVRLQNIDLHLYLSKKQVKHIEIWQYA